MMPIIKKTKGDLLDLFDAGHFSGIAHGCNCFHAMGSGIAADVRLRYIEAYKADMMSNFGDPQKLGGHTEAKIKQGTIYNLYTQYQPGRQTNMVDLYDNISRAFDNLNTVSKASIDYRSVLIGIPMIGCGIAGGDWRRVAEIIDDATPDIPIIFVEFAPIKHDLYAQFS